VTVLRTQFLGWQNKDSAWFIVTLRLGDLSVPLLRTDFFDTVSVAELGRMFDHCSVHRRYRPDGAEITFWNDKSAAHPATEATPDVCVWTESEEGREHLWDTGCKAESWNDACGGPFCPFCGKPRQEA
jgi:hypothetical protein